MAPRRRGRAWLVYLAVAVVQAAAYLVLPQHTALSGVVDDVGGFACAVAIVVGVRLHRPARRGPWYLFAAAQACNGVADVVWSVTHDVLHQDPFPGVADVFYLVAYPLAIAGLFLLVRERTAGRDLAGLLDAAVVSAGLGLLSWTFLMRPVAVDHSQPLLNQLVSLAYPLADVLLIAMLARLLTTPGGRTASFRLIVLALLCLLVADVAFAAVSLVTQYDGGGADALWMVAYGAWAAATLHPSMRSVGDTARGDATRLTFPRFALLGLTTLIVPGVLAWQGFARPADIDWPGVAVGSLVLSLLVLARIWTLVRQVRQQSLQLNAMAHSDPLTGAANRRTWDATLPLAMSAAARSGTALSVAILDLDRFKAYNDRFGHQGGDRLLKEATAAWRSQLRAEDLLARYGGEEFCVLLAGSAPQEVAAALERLRAATPRGQTFSAGVARWDGAETADALLGRADAALYAAKAAGRDRVRFAADAQPVTSRS